MNEESETKLAERALGVLIQFRQRVSVTTSEEVRTIASEVQSKSGVVFSGEMAANHARNDAWLAISKVGITIKEEPDSKEVAVLLSKAIDLTKIWIRALN